MTIATDKPYTICFEVEGSPPLPNLIMYQHWTKKRKHAQKWKDAVIRAVKFLSPYEPKLKKARVTLTRYSSRECDWDNLAASFKHVVDGLVLAGILEDDRQSVIGAPIFKWIKCKRKEARIGILVEELEYGKTGQETDQDQSKETKLQAD